MGYPIFGNVRTLTLPIPASDMTSAEYKEAFGIDLANIELYDLILLCDSDKQIHPVLVNDTENKVLYTAEGAYSYNGGFAVVEGDSLVSKVIETGTIENAKPVYCHPITFTWTSTGTSFRLGCLIFDNNPDPYTWDTFKAKCKAIAESIDATARIVATGGFYTDGHLNVAQVIDCQTSGIMNVYAIKDDGTTISNYYRVDNVTVSEFYDSVNKIN